MKLTTLYINSKNRMANGTHTDFKINLTPYGLTNIKKYCIKNATIPFSYYSTSYANGNPNGFQIVDFQVGFLGYTLKIPFGTYPYSDLALIIQDQLNANLLTSAFVVSYDSHTSKFTISNNTVFSILWGSTQYAGTPYYKLLSTVLGFNNVDLSGQTSYTSSFTANLSGGMNIYIKSNALSYSRSVFFENKPNTVILGIPNMSAYGGIITYFDQELIMQYNGTSQLNVIDFQLVDEYDNIIDLNGLDWSFILCFYTEYN
jgi:hypothetical protein